MTTITTAIECCIQSSLYPRHCCSVEIGGNPCRHPPVYAVLTADMTEHIRCEIHTAAAVETRPFQETPVWAALDPIDMLV